MKRLCLRLTIAACLVVAIFNIQIAQVYAGRLEQRSITLGTSRPGATTTHTMNMTLASNVAVGSIVFEYCSNSPLFDSPCIAPTGLDLTNATIASQTGATGFVINNGSTANNLILSKPAASTYVGAAEYIFENVTNPTTNGTQYVRMSTHGSSDGTGGRIDDGGVAYSVQQGINTEAYVPPFLLFCSAVNVALDCSSANGFYIDLGELSTSMPKTGQSQYSGATNDSLGYTVSIFGTSLTSGNQVIPALTSPAASQPGTSQFGINLRDNFSPDSGQEPIGTGTASGTPDYNQPNNFVFNSGDTISSSNISTDFNRFTVTYLTNISSSQPAGIYSATYTFIAVASF